MGSTIGLAPAPFLAGDTPPPPPPHTPSAGAPTFARVAPAHTFLRVCVFVCLCVCLLVCVSVLCSVCCAQLLPTLFVRELLDLLWQDLYTRAALIGLSNILKYLYRV